MKKQIVLLTVALAALAGVASAEIDYQWTSGTGDWLDPNWTPANPVWDSNADGNIVDGTVNLTATSRPTNTIRDVYLIPSGGSPVLNISGDLSCRTVLLGHEYNTGTATINQTAGTVTTTGIDYIGYKGTSTNTYNLTGGTLVGGTANFYVTKDLVDSMGILNINGGTLESEADNFALADGTSFLTVGNGGKLIHTGASYFLIGRDGHGTATIQTNGTVTSTANNQFTLAYSETGVGVLNMEGGTLTHTGTGYFLVGRRGSGTLNLNGGTVESAADQFILGYNLSSSGTLNLTNGTLKTTGTQLILAKYDDAVGTANVAGGTLQCDSTYFDFGLRGNATGILNLSGGLVKHTGSYFRVGQQGHGVVNQTGGTADIRGLILADAAGSSGLYSISGGALSVDKYIFGHTADAVFEVDGSGATKIETQSVLFPAGTLRFKLDENGSTLLKAVGGYRSDTNAPYRGIELTNATVEVEALAGFDGVAGDAYDLMWTTNGYLTNGMTFVDNSGAGFEWRIVAKDGGEVFQVWIPGGSPSENWAIGYGLSGDDAKADADPDNDGLSNLYEYGLGGDPTNSANTGISPVYGMVADGGTNWFEYVYPRRSAPDSGLTYHLELTDDLVYTDWANSGYTVVGTGTINDDFDAVTNRIPFVADERFVRLVIEE